MPSERVEMVQAIFAGLKDICLVVASVATIWIQASNAGKLEVLKNDSTAIAKTASEGTDTITAWKAEYQAKGQP